jgi:hypothetical protein
MAVQPAGFNHPVHHPPHQGGHFGIGEHGSKELAKISSTDRAGNAKGGGR